MSTKIWGYLCNDSKNLWNLKTLATVYNIYSEAFTDYIFRIDFFIITCYTYIEIQIPLNVNQSLILVYRFPYLPYSTAYSTPGTIQEIQLRLNNTYQI